MYVMRPTAPSPGSSMPSYNCCAIIIVFLTGNRAACCSLLVMKGGTAFFLRSFVATDATVHVAPRRSARTVSDSAWLVTLMFEPPRLSSFASNSGGTGPARRAVMFQYSSATKRSISRSRSTTSLSATDCTRPALRPRRTLSQSSGLIL